jgi:hypothetical protein
LYLELLYLELLYLELLDVLAFSKSNEQVPRLQVCIAMDDDLDVEEGIEVQGKLRVNTQGMLRGLVVVVLYEVLVLLLLFLLLSWSWWGAGMGTLSLECVWRV